MRRYIPFFIAVLSLGSNISQAQSVPGYLGKRFSIDYNLFTFLSWANPSSAEIKDPNQLEYYDVTNGSLGINIQSHITGQWVWTKQRSLITSVAFTESYFSPEGSNDDITITSFPKLNVVAFDIGVRKFKQHFSPLGNYFEMRLGMAIVTPDDFIYNYGWNGQHDSIGVISGTSGITPQASFSWGTNRVLKDLIVISYGIDFTVPLIGMSYLPLLGGVLGGETDGSHYLFYFEEDTAENQKSLRRQAMGRYAAQSMINFKIGIGILL